MIFLSSAVADSPVVNELRRAIAKEFVVRDPADVPSGNAWSSSIEDALETSWVAEAATLSLAEHRPVTIAEVRDRLT